jgi:hypothetical protein
MIMTALVHPSLLPSLEKDCNLEHKKELMWPLSDYVPKGPGCGVLVAKLDPDQVPCPLTVGIFETSSLYELVWNNSAIGSDLFACIGGNGIRLKQAIVIREVERFQKIYGFEYRIKAFADGSLQITMKGFKHGSRDYCEHQPKGRSDFGS